METVPEQEAEFANAAQQQQVNGQIVAGSQGAEMQHVENNINFIQQAANGAVEAREGVEYEGDEEGIICGRFPHLEVCACEVNSAVALKEINLFQVYPGIYMGPF